MYTKEEASNIRQQFWTSFGKYMSPVLSAEGNKINWINYKTGIRQLYFRMDVTKSEATIAVEVMHKEPDFAKKLYQQFLFLKTEFETVANDNWIWEELTYNEYGFALSRISMQQAPLNIFKQSDWPEIISFLKPGIISLDTFWVENKIIFETII